ncbi:MAG TPA: CHC2 zinc finger domain-containing protein, partial [Flavobacteriaceae bacterium]|nr:CHC2 zinc finger domain-containing protein [Flavobacteriaceae bacterium]
MIKQTTIDQIFETARVEEVIADFIQLKRSGSNFKGLSPFTDERTPSFMVSPVKQIWKDFSSGKGGNVVSFLMEHEHFNYPQALEYLANK